MFKLLIILHVLKTLQSDQELIFIDGDFTNNVKPDNENSRLGISREEVQLINYNDAYNFIRCSVIHTEYKIFNLGFKFNTK